MQYSELGRTGLKVSRCCLGTMMWGGGQNTEADGHAQMDYALTRGVTFWDTAEMYAIPPRPETQGETERIIGRWFAKNPGKRQDVILASKVAGRSPMTWLRKDGSPTSQTRAQIDEAVESSLKRLQTDYIDLYQLHWPDRPIRTFGGMTFQDYSPDYESFEAILEALQAHIQKGNIRHIGVSNETAWGVMKFVEASERLGLPRMASIQNAYNLVNRTFELGLAEVAMREQVGLLVYSPVGQGYLIGKYLDGQRPPGARTTLFNRGQRYEGPGAEKAIRSYVELAKARGIAPETLAIKFCDSRPFVTSTIIGASTMEQLKADIDAFDFEWTSDLETAVDALHYEQPNPCP
ncbi:MAG TPA: aldo/keto reductase [Caulobacteraceae bacterium]|nr:aldo/keto reductase [Caulobacteraceae bacterium]